jgi:hypothetical protein
MKSLKLAFIAMMLFSAKTLLASDLNLSLNEFEVKEEVARSLGLNAQQIDIAPAAIEYVSDDSVTLEGVNVKGRFFITWAVRDNLSSDNSETFTSNGVTMTSNNDSVDGTKKIVNSVKIGYQVFEHLGAEIGYEKSNSTMGVSSLANGQSIGQINSPNIVSGQIKNDFQTVKIGLMTNVNLVSQKSFRLDLVAEASGGVMQVNSSYKNDGDVYKGAIGYTYGGEVGVRAIHKSGVYLATGVGMNNRVIAPMKSENGNSESQFNGSDKYIFVSVGYSFGGKKRK